jgi:hypothetical protein
VSAAPVVERAAEPPGSAAPRWLEKPPADATRPATEERHQRCVLLLLRVRLVFGRRAHEGCPCRASRLVVYAAATAASVRMRARLLTSTSR